MFSFNHPAIGNRCCNGGKSSIIKRFIFGVIVAIGILFAFYAYAYQNKPLNIGYDKTSYFDLQKTTLRNTSGIPNEADWEAYQKRIAYKVPSVKNQTAGYGGSCVAFAKNYLGIGGVWGNGGRALSLNSGPEVGAVVIFTYTHVGVVIADNGLAITVMESNYVARNTIGYRTILKTDTTIKGYHKF